MWQVAFSSKSVSQKTRPVRLTARRAVDERDLAEVRAPARRSRAAGGRCPRRCRRSPRRSFRPRSAPRGRRRALPAARSGARRAHGALGAAPVRAREDLLRGHVRDVLDPGLGLERRRAPARGGQEPDGEIGAGPAEADRVEAALVQRRPRAPGALATCSARRATGSGSSSRVAVRDGVPQALDVRLAEDLRRPALRSARRRSSS